MPNDSRWSQRRCVYLGEGLTFEILSGAARLEAEAIDLTPEGLGLALMDGAVVPGLGDTVTVSYTGRGASDVPQEAVVRHVGGLRTGGRWRPRIGLSLVPDSSRAVRRERRAHARHACPDALPAFATAACPWFFQESLRFRIQEVGAGGMTLRTTRPLLPRAELAFELQLASIGVERARGRLTSVRRADAGAFEVGVAWIDPPRELLRALSQYLLAGDETLTPALLRAGGLAVGSVARAVTYDCATSSADLEEILALRLRAQQAEGHLLGKSVADLRSPFDAHSRHVTCRFGRRIVGYVRVIFVDGDPARSQYVSLGGHEVPQWLWDAGFVEGGAGATHPDFQRTGLYFALMQHMFRVAVQSGHRYVLGASPDGLLGMYREMGFEVLEERLVEPKPGWSFRSHLMVADAERLLREPSASRNVAAMASAVAFAGLPVAA
jgi:GNAT superfamily N-acetyltransferase